MAGVRGVKKRSTNALLGIGRPSQLTVVSSSSSTDSTTTGLKISELLANNPASALTDADGFEITQAGASKGATALQLRQYIGDGISVRDFGAVGDGVTDDTDAVTAWLLAAAAQGRTASATGGVYLVTAIDIDITSNLDIELHAGARIKGAAGFATPVLAIDGGVPLPRPRVSITGQGAIDNSLRTYVLAVESGTALELKRLTYFTTYGIHYDAGNSYLGGFGDSGIAAQEVSEGFVSACKFTGQPDIGIYITGGALTATSDDSYCWVVSGNYFSQCGIVVSSRRQANRVTFVNNVVEDCYQGFQSTSTGDLIPPGRECLVTGNQFNRVATRPVELRWAQEGSVISGNTCVDCATDNSATWGVIQLLGCRSVTVIGNTIAYRDVVPDAGSSAISIGNHTIDGVPKISVDNIIANNTIRDMTLGCRDTSTGPNYADQNLMVAVTTPYSGTATWQYRHVTSTGHGIDTFAPAEKLHVVGQGRFARVGATGQYVNVEQNASVNGVRSYTSSTSAKQLRIASTTDSSNTTPSVGAVGILLATLAIDNWGLDVNGMLRALSGSLSRGLPVTKTADFTVAVTENWLINNKAASTCTVTLPAAATFPGREIMIQNYQAFTVVSASANVVPLAGTAAATPILGAAAGRWVTLVSNGTNWVVTQGVP